MMSALREYAHVNSQVAYHLWVLVFPIVWATLEKTMQINLAKPIISLLSKEYHQRQAAVRPNVIQVGYDLHNTFLRCFADSQKWQGFRDESCLSVRAIFYDGGSSWANLLTTSLSMCLGNAGGY